MSAWSHLSWIKLLSTHITRAQEKFTEVFHSWEFWVSELVVLAFWSAALSPLGDWVVAGGTILATALLIAFALFAGPLLGGTNARPKRGAVFGGCVLAVVALAFSLGLNLRDSEDITTSQLLPRYPLMRSGLGMYYNHDVQGSEDWFTPPAAILIPVDWDALGNTTARAEISVAIHPKGEWVQARIWDETSGKPAVTGARIDDSWYYNHISQQLPIPQDVGTHNYVIQVRSGDGVGINIVGDITFSRR